MESDQETMAPPIKSKKKRNSSFVLPKLVKSQLRKMSGVFSSFLTPEKRMVRRIAELARDKRTYFGCLVQDYVSFLQENKDTPPLFPAPSPPLRAEARHRGCRWLCHPTHPGSRPFLRDLDSSGSLRGLCEC